MGRVVTLRQPGVAFRLFSRTGFAGSAASTAAALLLLPGFGAVVALFTGSWWGAALLHQCLTLFLQRVTKMFRFNCALFWQLPLLVCYLEDVLQAVSCRACGSCHLLYITRQLRKILS